MEHLINIIVPLIIHLLEILGILIVVIGVIQAFTRYLKNLFSLGDNNIKIELAKALAFALEFKLAGEILKTVVIRTFDEMLILASVIAIRALLAFVIHLEIKADSKHCREERNALEAVLREQKAS